MKLKEIREAYDYFSGKTSDIVRYLGLAGIGIIWIFRVEDAGRLSLPRELIFPTVLLIMGLGLDLLQYIAGSLTWGIYGRLQEKKGIKKDEEFEAPKEINWPGLIFFWSKIIPILGAYYLILAYLFRTFSI
jgi:hypothetical protein